MSKHTPGPWKVRDWMCGSVGNAHQMVAMCYGNTRDGKRDAVQDANARLIAAAPELLEALESIRDCCDEDHAARDYASRQTEIRGIARSAIAKATGEEA